MLKLQNLTESEILDVDGLTYDELSDEEDNDNSDNEESADIIHNDTLLDDDSGPTATFENLKSTSYSGDDQKTYSF